MAMKKKVNKTKRTSIIIKRKMWLKRPEDVRRLLSSTINELRRGEIEAATAGKIGYLANILLSALTTIKDEEIEERLKALEYKLDKDIKRGMIVKGKK